MEQWEADIAVGYAKQDYTVKQAVQLAKRAIRAIEDRRDRDVRRLVNLARLRWNRRRRQERFYDYVTEREAMGRPKDEPKS